MSKIYTVNNGKSRNEQIPSIGYIDEIVKMIEDKLVNKDVEGFPSIKGTMEELPVGVKSLPEILAKDIKTDSQHKFINDAVLATVTEKPSKFEMEQSLEDIKIELKSYMDELYTRIINTPNVINKLRDISTILNEDEIVDGLLNTLAYKLNIEDYNNHIKSSSHINNNDRKALNVLIRCLSDGFADWNAKKGEYNAIKNKPKSLPANGGNADTIDNHGIKDLINKDDYDIVIGTSEAKYSKDSCDIYAENGKIDTDVLSSHIDSLNVGGIILLKRGSYNTDLMHLYNKSIILKGFNNKLTSIKVNKLVDLSNITIENININTSDDPESIKAMFIEAIVELQEQINPRQVSRQINKSE